MALEQSDRSRVDWFVAHGSGTPINDRMEVDILREIFGDALRRIPLTALKPSIGHCLGACGTIEPTSAVLALRKGFIPRVRGLREIDPELARAISSRKSDDLMTEY